MGSPAPGTPAWFRKLERNRLAAQTKRDDKFCTSARGKRVLDADRRRQAIVTNRELDTLRTRSNRYMRAANEHKKKADATASEVKRLQRRLRQTASKAEALQAQVDSLLAKKKSADAELQRLRFSWDWLLAKVSAKEARRLRWLSATPPKNRDRCRGGGQ